ncbi:CYFA0S20e02190g1_1 [Cyberlindnera fabianii]|uniref:CYFA0S20e02190g1_1 n=1 Tax=Cyberlindnera fabianii TaxID=36022 RepID=A0A061B7R6_CYBFA|nr:CYFA0S20e02190g1_1 [Cyberlindnera fabianii]
MASPLLYAKNGDGYVFKLSHGASAALHIGLNGSHLVKPELFPVSGINQIASIIGVIRLRSSRYIIVASKTAEVGQIRGNSILKVVEYKVLPLSNSFLKDDDEQKYLELLKFHLDTAQLYFSYNYDLTNSHQRLSEQQRAPGAAIWKHADNRFFWNYYVTEELMDLAKNDSNVDPFIVPLIYGYANIIDTTTNLKAISFGIITRRSRFRAGTRYFRRGIDANGNVANYNETEQLLIVHSAKDAYETYSYIQTRGSVPVYWAEVNNLKYKPDLSIGEPPLDATKKHFDQQIELYGENYLVNLVNQKGYELPVKNAYENIVSAINNPKLHYVYFDYHHECRNLKWHRVKILIEHLTKLGLSNDDFYHERSVDGVAQVLHKQGSVVRTNCMDCLDRTNVVQSTMAHWILQRQFEVSGVLSPGHVWENDKSLLFKFQNMWADNADAVSKAYSGTGALKTDYTRTGKRTKKGALNDLINSITRYYRNNLRDGPRQDSFDLFLGQFAPFESVQSPFDDKRPPFVQAVPYIFLASSVLFLATLIFPRGSLTSLKNFFLLATCFLASGFTGHYMLKNGLQFVSWPNLVDLDFLIKRDIFADGKVSGVRFVKNTKYHSPTTSKAD